MALSRAMRARGDLLWWLLSLLLAAVLVCLLVREAHGHRLDSSLIPDDAALAAVAPAPGRIDFSILGRCPARVGCRFTGAQSVT